MALNVIDKINLRFKFLYRQNRFLTPPLCKLLCNALIKPLSDYGCTNLVSKSSKKTKIKTSSNAKKMHKFLPSAKQNVWNLCERVSRIKLV